MCEAPAAPKPRAVTRSARLREVSKGGFQSGGGEAASKGRRGRIRRGVGGEERGWHSSGCGAVKRQYHKPQKNQSCACVKIETTTGGFGAVGVSHDNPRTTKRAHLRFPAFENTTKIQREDTQREKKRANCWLEREKKREILGGPAEGGPAEEGSGARWSKPITTPPTRTTTTNTNHNRQQTTPRKNKHRTNHTQHIQQNTHQHHQQHHNNTQQHTTIQHEQIGQKWPNHQPLTTKNGLAKIGWPNGLAKIGLAEVGHYPEPQALQ